MVSGYIGFSGPPFRPGRGFSAKRKKNPSVDTGGFYAARGTCLTLFTEPVAAKTAYSKEADAHEQEGGGFWNRIINISMV